MEWHKCQVLLAFTWIIKSFMTTNSTERQNTVDASNSFSRICRWCWWCGDWCGSGFDDGCDGCFVFIRYMWHDEIDDRPRKPATNLYPHQLYSYEASINFDVDFRPIFNGPFCIRMIHGWAKIKIGKATTRSTWSEPLVVESISYGLLFITHILSVVLL